MKILSKDDVLDLLFGATYLGTGGGGELEEGIALIDEAVSAGKSFKLQSFNDAPDDALACTPYFLGAISQLPPEEEALYDRLPKPQGQPIQWAFEKAEAVEAASIYGAIPCELGGSNTAVAFYIAAMNDGVVLDGDPAGRAVPEITHSTYYMKQLPASPIYVSNAFGEVIICENIIDDKRAEHLIRSIAIASRNDVAAIDHILPIAQLRNAIIPNTLSLSWELGKECKLAISEGRDVAAVLAKIGGGRVAFLGTVTQSQWRTEDGFTKGHFSLAGDEAFVGEDYKIKLKNENLVSWRNGEIDACIPELICAVDRITGHPITNPNTEIGQQVAIVVLPAPAAFNSEIGHQIFGRDYAGL